MPNWIKENKTPITVAISSIVAMTAIVGILQTSINSIHHRFDDMNQRLNDMNHRLNDMNHRLNDFTAEMNQRFDAQDKYINQRFDAQDKYINQRFDDQDKYINQRFDAVDRRIEDLAKDTSELRKLSDRVSRNETQNCRNAAASRTRDKNTRDRQALTPTTLPANDVLCRSESYCAGPIFVQSLLLHLFSYQSRSRTPNQGDKPMA